MGRDADQTRPAAPKEQAHPAADDVDAILAESLRAQPGDDFTWKEPERRPRWWQRQDVEQPQSRSETTALAQAPTRGIRLGSVILGTACLMLALWVMASTAFGLSIDPLVVGLVVCTVAGLVLVAAGLRPKPGARL